MNKVFFSSDLLSEWESLEIRGGADNAPNGASAQSACINGAAGCGAGVSQPNCINMATGCGSQIGCQGPPSTETPTPTPPPSQQPT